MKIDVLDRLRWVEPMRCGERLGRWAWWNRVAGSHYILAPSSRVCGGGFGTRRMMGGGRWLAPTMCAK